MNQESVEYLKNFKNLLDEGLITQEEFDAKKAELLQLNVANEPAQKEAINKSETSPANANVTSTDVKPAVSIPQNNSQFASVPTSQQQNAAPIHPLDNQHVNTAVAGAAKQKGINQGDIAFVVIGIILVIVGLFSFGSYAPNLIFGTDYFTAQYEATCHTAQAASMVVAGIGAMGICAGVRNIVADQKKEEEKKTK